MLSPCSDAFRMRLESPSSLCRPRCFSCLRRMCHRPRAPRAMRTSKASTGPRIRGSWPSTCCCSGGVRVAGRGGTLRPSFHQARYPHLATLPVRSQCPASPTLWPERERKAERWGDGGRVPVGWGRCWAGPEKMGRGCWGSRHTLQPQGHVVVAEGAVAAVVVDELSGAPPAELLVQVPAASVLLGLLAFLPHQHYCAPGPLAGRPPAVWVLTRAGHQGAPRGLHRVT